MNLEIIINTLEIEDKYINDKLKQDIKDTIQNELAFNPCIKNLVKEKMKIIVTERYSTEVFMFKKNKYITSLEKVKRYNKYHSTWLNKQNNTYYIFISKEIIKHLLRDKILGNEKYSDFYFSDYSKSALNNLQYELEYLCTFCNTNNLYNNFQKYLQNEPTDKLKQLTYLFYHEFYINKKAVDMYDKSLFNPNTANNSIYEIERKIKYLNKKCQKGVIEKNLFIDKFYYQLALIFSILAYNLNNIGINILYSYLESLKNNTNLKNIDCIIKALNEVYDSNFKKQSEQIENKLLPIINDYIRSFGVFDSEKHI